ncbi:glucose-6-phosphate 1-dehydrogenase [Paraliobacillus quinghaiensis]|uniref:Glucose-6-phosphate 1-dehydrogenase n=1 Tax=Paraliobacillus quinghaiensis TaxID=470815 RepID=A0A917WUN0_9BACI|nr:glucose-6-phosphate dehydrogenase [Paraliobacillus quinghaiensis]GGM30241.1 glucose-6-phosphate 1-dehydrogenase [Paraliobacillus quinghaiensis]
MTLKTPKAVIVIFGATGDLANRKLYPSLYRLYRNGKLSDNFAVIGVARRPLTNEQLRDNIKKSIADFNDTHIDADEFASHFHYNPFDVQDLTHYQKLDKFIDELDAKHQAGGNRLFYLAMDPNFFGLIAENLKSEGLTEPTGWTKLIIEKPFGHNYETAQKLNNDIRKAFTEDQIYRIDHYLGKQMIQNIEIVRFANSLFEPLWNNQYIANIQVTSSEILGVEERGRYYDGSGALRDMVQNHMLQMVSLLAMEPPAKLTPDDIRYEKVKVLRSLKPISEDIVDEHFVRGQYDRGEINQEEQDGYRESNGVDENSNTETFVAGKFMINNFRWAGVPFYIRTGKRMAKKATEIVVQFKDLPINLYAGKGNTIDPNLLVIRVQPDGGITLHLNAKQEDYETTSKPITMQYDMDGKAINRPEAYEVLLNDCLHGDSTNFVHWDEVALSWQYIDVISEAWSKKSSDEFPNYASGTNGPKAADELLENDGFHWWSVK